MPLPIYMDHHSTTPVDPRVFAVMEPFFREHYGNAASKTHAFGTRARKAVEVARQQVAKLIGARTNEVIFTSGATEANNLAIRGAAMAFEELRDHHKTARLIAQATEHKAVLDVVKRVAQGTDAATILDVDKDGRISTAQLRDALEQPAVLASIMLCNNEVGTVHDIDQIASLVRDAGALMHCDAAQGIGYLKFDVAAANVDLVSLSSHKLYGPKGVGALYIRRRVQHQDKLRPLIEGGGHESGYRSGTLNVPAIVGFGAACELMRTEGAAEAKRIARLRNSLYKQITDALDGITLNGPSLEPESRHPGNLNVSFSGVEGAKLLLELSEHVAISSGAACSSAQPEPSYVLQAMGVSANLAATSVRFGVGRSTSKQDIAQTAKAVISAIKKLRK